jgi:hypothetical protein
MRTFLKENKRQLLFIIRFLLIVFGTLSGILVLLATGNRLVPAVYAICFTLCVSSFCFFLIVALGYIEYVRENRFFKTSPYRLIAEKATTSAFVFGSVWFFSKRHYHFAIDGEHFIVIYFNNIIKTGYGNALLVFADLPGTDQKIMHLINYKATKLDENSLIKQLKNIKNESRAVLRDV